jgi:hypothetical protein
VNGLARWLAGIGAVCAAAPLAAQSAPPAQPAQAPPAAPTDAPSGDNDIVVTGTHTRPPTAKQVYDQARAITRVNPHQTYVVALPRFWEPVCPGVAGLRTEYAEAMIDRMRETIARLKAPLAKERCSPNLVVAFVDDGASFLTDLKRDRPDLFHLVSQPEQAELMASEAPVRVWNNIAMRWTGAGAPPRHGEKGSVWGQLNRNAMPESYDIVSALVVFDRDAVKTMSLTQLADYATMRGLSHTRPAQGGQPMATILSLFDADGAGPDAMTDFDFGYLRSLYWSVPNASAAKKLVDVQHFAEKAAKEPAPASP